MIFKVKFWGPTSVNTKNMTIWLKVISYPKNIYFLTIFCESREFCSYWVRNSNYQIQIWGGYKLAKNFERQESPYCDTSLNFLNLNFLHHTQQISNFASFLKLGRRAEIPTVFRLWKTKLPGPFSGARRPTLHRKLRSSPIIWQYWSVHISFMEGDGAARETLISHTSTGRRAQIRDMSA